MITSECFNFPSVAAEAGITEPQLETLLRRTLEENHGDLMMTELRMLRTCTAVADHSCTIEEALTFDDASPFRASRHVAEDSAEYGSDS